MDTDLDLDFDLDEDLGGAAGGTGGSEEEEEEGQEEDGGESEGEEDDAVGLDDEMDFLPECNAFEPQELAAVQKLPECGIAAVVGDFLTTTMPVTAMASMGAGEEVEAVAAELVQGRRLLPS